MEFSAAASTVIMLKESTSVRQGLIPASMLQIQPRSCLQGRVFMPHMCVDGQISCS